MSPGTLHRGVVAIALGLLVATFSVVTAQAAQGPSGGIDPSTLGPGNSGKVETVVPDDPKPASAGEADPSATDATITTDPNLGLSDPSGAAPACDGTQGPPPRLIPIYIQASKKYGLGERGPQILAAINRIETDFGRLNEVTSTAGAIGWKPPSAPIWRTP